MRRSTRKKKPAPIPDDPNEDSDENPSPLSKKMESAGDSSSDSDIESYLQPADKLDLNSTFFQIQKPPVDSFEAIEQDIFAGIDRLTDSDSDESKHEEETVASTSKLNFLQLHNYTSKLEEVKQIVQSYNAKRKENDANIPSGDNISDLLASGEMQVDELSNNESLLSNEFQSCSEAEDNDWEEVKDAQTKPSTSISKDGIQITVGLPDTMKKKKGVDLLASVQRRLNRLKKEHQVLIHKVHLLCWLAHGNYVNKSLNSETVLGLALSLIPSQHCYPPNRTDLTYLEQILNWYNNIMQITEKSISKQWSLEKVLKLQLTRKQAYDKQMLTYIFICVLRSLGIQCRLVLSFQVLPIRPPSSDLHSLSNKKNNNTVTPTKHNSDSENKNISKQKSNNALTKKENTNAAPEKLSSKGKSNRKDVQKKHAEKSNKKDEPTKVLKTKNIQTEKSGKRKEPSNLGKSQTKKAKPPQTRSKKLLPQLDGANDSSDSEKSTKPNLKKLSRKSERLCSKSHSKRLKKLPNYEEKLSSSDEENNEKAKRLVNLQTLKDKLNPRSKLTRSSDVKSDIVSIVKTRIKQEKEVSRSKIVKSHKSKSQVEEDSDYAPDPIKKKYDSDDDDFAEDKVKVKKRIDVKRARGESEQTKKGMDVWVEVYLEAEEKWISVDVVKNKVHCVQQLYARASHPVTYIVAWNNNNSIKDITQRYCMNWNTTTRKLRVDSKWWNATLKPYIGTKSARDKEEDEELMQLQLDKPLPSTISEYKNHPLYVLKRHLLKFEALYPPDVPSLGFVRGEPVYPRDCVHVLHSREIWLKEAKVVKPNQQPYKIVKARPKYDKLSGKVITDLPLEVFGVWQVEDYIPPIAENGIVPRNAYGNVELFKPCMLPKGTVHLQLPGLNKVAKKMGVDCVSAVVGFDFHSGWNHPTYDGFVVCEEHSEALVAAWYLEQEELEKKEVEKVEKRVYGNWRKLIRGLLIRERLKKRYDYGEPSETNGAGKKRKQKGPKFVSKKRRICSDSESN